MTKTYLSLLFVFGMVMSVFAQDVNTDPIVKVLKEELKHNEEQLAKQKYPAYFLSLRMEDSWSMSMNSVLGGCVTQQNHECFVVPQVRVGNKELDNFKYKLQNTQTQGRNVPGAAVPVEANALDAYRDAIWSETMNRYNIAVSNYEEACSKIKTDVDNEDKSPCFGNSPVEVYYEKPFPESVRFVDVKKWEAILNKVSSYMKSCRELDWGDANMKFVVSRKYVVNSEGSVVVHNRKAVRLFINASIKASDGTNCSLGENFFAETPDGLPDESVLMATAEDLVKRLIALRDAPLADPYAGPALISGTASGVFFHEIFGHRLETHRMKRGGQTFQKLVGTRVLPESFHVYDDPTLSTYNGQGLNGYYLYDDEGVKAKRVDNVKNGVMSDFLTSRMPVDGFPVSNGHGRASGGTDPVSRQSNLVVETTKPYSDAQLRQMLKDEAKKQGKEFGYFFRTATSGFTYTGEDNAVNSFNVEPVEVYKVYVDGRPDQLVRGVNLIGTPLSVFSSIEAGGETPYVFEGECGAESGKIPVTAISPMVLVSRIETQRVVVNRPLPRVLPKPEYTNEKMPSNSEERKDVIFRAMNDEMKRAVKDLHSEGQPAPWFVEYRMTNGMAYSSVSVLGGLRFSMLKDNQTSCASRLILGDSMKTSLPGPYNLFSGNINAAFDYDYLRRWLWATDDNMYKDGIKTYSRKMDYLKNHPLPDYDVNVPEFLDVPAKECINPSVYALTPYDTVYLNKVNREMSRVFLDYPSLYNTKVDISAIRCDKYRLTSSGLRIRVPETFVNIAVVASIRPEDGSEQYDKLSMNFVDVADIPSIEELKAEVRKFASLLVEKAKAEPMDEYYIGPVMLEDEAVNEAFYRNVISQYCLANRNFNYGSAKNSKMLGKRIIDTKLTVTQLSGVNTLDGQNLIGAYEMDADGIAPAKNLNMIENGLLKNLLCGNSPAVGALASTGNNRFMMEAFFTRTNIGTYKVSSSKTIAHNKMKAALMAEAKKAGLKYTYIVKAPRYGWRYLVRVDVRNGNEQMVRVQDTTIPSPSKYDLMHVTAVSREEFVSNKTEGSMSLSSVTPKSIIVENVEVNFVKPSKTAPFTLEYPRLRK